MARSRAEKLAYARGYNRGRVRSSEWAHKLLELVKRYRARVVDTESPRRCDGCHRWERGGPTCLWGRCAMANDTTAFVVEPGAWPDHVIGQTRARDLITHENFGCTNWLPK